MQKKKRNSKKGGKWLHVVYRKVVSAAWNKEFLLKLFERATSWLSFHFEKANIAFRNFAFCSLRKICFEFDLGDLGAKDQTWNFI